MSCPACGGAPRLPRDLRQEVRCGCGARLRLALVPVRAVKPAPVAPQRELQPAAAVAPAREAPRPRGVDLDGVVFARPVMVYRAAGAEREWQWGAATDTPVAPGDRLLIVAKNGKTWNATVEAVVGSTGTGPGHLVTLAGGTWQPASPRGRETDRVLPEC